MMDINDEAAVDDLVDRGSAAVGAMLLAAVSGSVWGVIGLSIGYLVWG